MMIPRYMPSTAGLPGSKGLYFLTPRGLRVRNHVLKLWREIILEGLGGVEISTPVLLPPQVLERSGHTSDPDFGTELMATKENYLRPETVQGIIPNYKVIRRMVKGTPLVIGQVGLAFRREKTTRQGILRQREFEQAEIQIFHRGQTNQLLARLRVLVREFLDRLSISYEELIPLNLPHYSRGTWDLMAPYNSRLVEIGSLNDRANHDLGPQDPVQVLELSLGLTRLVVLCPDSVVDQAA